MIWPIWTRLTALLDWGKAFVKEMKLPNNQNTPNNPPEVVLRRCNQVTAGKRDPLKDYNEACESVRRARIAFRASADKRSGFSPSAADMYARALQEVDLCTQVLGITDALKKAS